MTWSTMSDGELGAWLLTLAEQTRAGLPARPPDMAAEVHDAAIDTVIGPILEASRRLRERSEGGTDEGQVA